MRVAPVGSIRLALAVGVVSALVAPGAAPAMTHTTATAAAAAATPGPAFKVTISPGYTTAGEQTTFRVTVVNTSSPGTSLGSVSITPPTGFKPPHPAPGTPLRGKTQVHNRTLSLRRVAIKPGKAAQLSITATAPTKCGSAVLHWNTKAFEGATGSGTRLALRSAPSSLGVTVLCPDVEPCGVGGPACSTSLVTSNSTYAVISNAASGTLTQTVNVGGRLRCGAYRFRDPNWYDSVVIPPTGSPPTTPAAPIVDSVSYTIRNATAKGIGFCLGVAYEFTTASGKPAPAGTLPNGKPGFIGLLPLCTNSKAPCIQAISQQEDPQTKTGFDALMTIQIPESGDPWGAG